MSFIILKHRSYSYTLKFITPITNMSNNNCGCHPPSGNKPDYQKMQALTAILNPGNTSKVLLYQSLTTNGTLGYEQAAFSPKHDVKAQGYGSGVTGHYEEPSPLSPVIKFGSNIVSLIVEDTVHIYGVSAHTNSLCLLSPVYQPLKAAEVDTTLTGKIAGCTNGRGQGWLYMQKRDNQSTKTTGYIYEKSLTKLTETPVKIPATKDAKAGTDIVAFHDGKRRWIAFQTWYEDDDEENTESHIQIVCLDDESAKDHPIPDSKNVIDKELVELAATHAVKNGKELIYIYFRGQGGSIYWSSAEIAKGGARFSRPKDLEQKTKLDRRSSLALLPDADGIVLYGIKKGGKNADRRDKSKPTTSATQRSDAAVQTDKDEAAIAKEDGTTVETKHEDVVTEIKTKKNGLEIEIDITVTVDGRKVDFSIKTRV
ncbi:hypothetical protein FAVG1_07576 [Fusarium avenaceum]|nr:hypothetical protein FAVG1_07576 [Fusarium avenaceum]